MEEVCRHNPGICSTKSARRYVSSLEHVFGKGSCHILFIRQKGAGKIEIVEDPTDVFRIII